MLLTLTLVVVALVVVGLVAYLTAVAVTLMSARRSITGIADALEGVARHTAPLEERLVTINGALSALLQGLEAGDHQLGRAARACRL